VDFEPRGVARDLTELRDALGDALDALAALDAQLTVAKAARQRATKAFDVFFGKGARFLESGLDLAGLEELAAQVRPGVGRRGRPRSAIAEPGRPPLAPGTLGLDAGADEPGLRPGEAPEAQELPKNPDAADNDGESEV
jgi:hypothetical protein